MNTATEIHKRTPPKNQQSNNLQELVDAVRDEVLPDGSLRTMDMSRILAALNKMSEATDPDAYSNQCNKIICFSLGQIVATPGALELLDRGAVNAAELLQRHQCGDWGNVPPEDAAENDNSVVSGCRILSSYPVADERIWIITEADRSSTTLLLPEEY